MDDGFFNGIDGQLDRSTQRNIIPTGVQSRQVDRRFVFNSSQVTTLFSGLANNSQVVLKTTFTAAPNTSWRVATAPFQIAIFQDTGNGIANTAYQIPFGSSIGATDYVVAGPFGVPQLTSIGTDGNNVVFQTGITNKSGGSKNLIFITQARLIIAGLNSVTGG